MRRHPERWKLQFVKFLRRLWINMCWQLMGLMARVLLMLILIFSHALLTSVKEGAAAQNALEATKASKNLARCRRRACSHEALPAGQRPVNVARNRCRCVVGHEERMNSVRLPMPPIRTQWTPQKPGNAKLSQIDLGLLYIRPEAASRSPWPPQFFESSCRFCCCPCPFLFADDFELRRPFPLTLPLPLPWKQTRLLLRL